MSSTNCLCAARCAGRAHASSSSSRCATGGASVVLQAIGDPADPRVDELEGSIVEEDEEQWPFSMVSLIVKRSSPRGRVG